MKPELLIHIGHGKTGSTAIQKCLRAAAPDLEANGIYFPDPAKHDNHQDIFVHLTGSPKYAPPKGQSEEQRRAYCEAQWDIALAHITATQPKRVILSCENQFRPFSKEAFERMNGLLAPHFSKIDVVAYLRSPSSYFLSAVQQDLKKRPEFDLPSASRYRDTLEPWRDMGPGPLTAHLFVRDALYNGNVVDDFWHRYLPEMDASAIPQLVDVNTTVSAEAMDVFQDFFRGKFDAPARYYAKRDQRMKALIRQADADVSGGAKPRLLDGLREIIDARCTDLDWLAQEFGITFIDLHPSNMTADEADAIYNTWRDVSDICPVDADRKAALVRKITEIAKRDQSLTAKLRRAFARG